MHFLVYFDRYFHANSTDFAAVTKTFKRNINTTWYVAQIRLLSLC